jgi:signal transduction histidine kinase
MNAIKHGYPDSIDIILAKQDGQLEITVQDNGNGFDISILDTYVSRGFGLFSIRERIKNVGGILKIGSRPGIGTVAIIKVPLKPINEAIEN